MNGEPIDVTWPIDTETLLRFALEWHQLAEAASRSSQDMAARQFPMSRVLEAQAIARRALELAALLQRWAEQTESSR